MAVINCPECGKEISDKMEACPYCKHKIKKHTLGIKIGIGVILIAIVVFAILYINEPTKKFVEAINKADQVKASQIYTSKIKGSSKKEEKILTALNKYLGESIQQYGQSTLSYEEITKILNMITEIQISNLELTQYQDKVKEIKQSKEAYTEAEQFIKAEQYDKAMEQLQKVSSLDSNYEQAQNLISETADKYKQQVIQLVKDEYNKKEYKKAINIANKALESEATKDNEELLQELEKVKQDYMTEILAETDKYIKKSELVKAYYLIDKSITDYFTDDTKLLEKKDTISKAIVQKCLKIVKNLIAKDRYFEAISYLDKFEKYDTSGVLTKKSKSIKEKDLKNYSKRKIKQIKNDFTIQYDKTNKKFTIIPKGYSASAININAITNLEARVMFDKNGADYFMIMGFINSNFISMNEIKFFYGGSSQELLAIPKSGAKKSSLVGSVAEWYTVAHVEGSDSSTKGIADLANIIEKLKKSQKTVVRFIGKQKLDHKITEKERKNLIDLWEFCELYNYDTSLYSLLK